MRALRFLTPQTGSLCRGLIGVAAAATLLAQAPAPALSRRGALRHYGRWRVLVDSASIAGWALDEQPATGFVIGRQRGTLWHHRRGRSLDSGTVFSLAPSASHGGAWTEATLYSFPAFAGDGWSPTGIAIGSGGVVYGVTGNGGSFDDGMFPNSLLITPNGGLLGTTNEGGAGAGAVFSLTPPASPDGAWSETSFRFLHNGRQGKNPRFVAIGPNGIYGSTLTNGPSGTSGGGTVFSLIP
jgi:hypothetical protein